MIIKKKSIYVYEVKNEYTYNIYNIYLWRDGIYRNIKIHSFM